jgi:hypothetical protein
MNQPGHIDRHTEEAVRRFLALIAPRYDMAALLGKRSASRPLPPPAQSAAN